MLNQLANSWVRTSDGTFLPAKKLVQFLAFLDSQKAANGSTTPLPAAPTFGGIDTAIDDRFTALTKFVSDPASFASSPWTGAVAKPSTALGTATVLNFPDPSGQKKSGTNIALTLKPSVNLGSNFAYEFDEQISLYSPGAFLKKLLGTDTVDMGKLTESFGIPIKAQPATVTVSYAPPATFPAPLAFLNEFDLTPVATKPINISGPTGLQFSTDDSQLKTIQFCLAKTGQLLPASPVAITAQITCTAQLELYAKTNLNALAGLASTGPSVRVAITGTVDANAYIISASLESQFEALSANGRVGFMYALYKSAAPQALLLYQPFVNIQSSIGHTTVVLNITALWGKTYPVKVADFFAAGPPSSYDSNFPPAALTIP